jgi:hypothetical protein
LLDMLIETREDVEEVWDFYQEGSDTDNKKRRIDYQTKFLSAVDSLIERMKG